MNKYDDLVGAYLKYVSDDKKDFIPRRMELFNVILEKSASDKSFK